MALIVQDDNGQVAGANAYVTVAEYRAYHADRGVDVTAQTDDAVAAAIVRATQYLDVRFYFIGVKKNREQTTQWPRSDAVDANDFEVNDVPDPVKWACCEYAQRAITKNLMPDPVRSASGYAVTQESKKVGPISKFTQYAGAGFYNWPEYPVADGYLYASGLVLQGRRTSRS